MISNTFYRANKDNIYNDYIYRNNIKENDYIPVRALSDGYIDLQKNLLVYNTPNIKANIVKVNKLTELLKFSTNSISVGKSNITYVYEGKYLNDTQALCTNGYYELFIATKENDKYFYDNILLQGSIINLKTNIIDIKLLFDNSLDNNYRFYNLICEDGSHYNITKELFILLDLRIISNSSLNKNILKYYIQNIFKYDNTPIVYLDINRSIYNRVLPIFNFKNSSEIEDYLIKIKQNILNRLKEDFNNQDNINNLTTTNPITPSESYEIQQEEIQDNNEDIEESNSEFEFTEEDNEESDLPF